MLVGAVASVYRLIELNPYTKAVKDVVVQVGGKVTTYVNDLLKVRDARTIAYNLLSDALNQKLKAQVISVDKYKTFLAKITKTSSAEELMEIYEILTKTN